MREACGIRNALTKRSSVINLETEENTEDHEAFWKAAHLYLCQALLAQKIPDITKHMLSRLKIPNSPSLSKEALLKELETRNIVAKSDGRGKTAEVLLLQLHPRMRLSEVITHEARNCSQAYAGQHCLSEFDDYVRGHSHRQGNALLLGKVCVLMIKQRSKGRGRPNLPGASVECRESLSERGSKMLEQEDRYNLRWQSQRTNCLFDYHLGFFGV